MPNSNGSHSVLKHITKCRLCQQPFTAPAMDVPIIGEPPSAKTIRMLEALGKHVFLKHPEHWKSIEAGSTEFKGLLLGLSFETEDLALIQLREMARYNIHLLTRRNVVTDRTITERVQNLQETGALTEESVCALMADLRDALLELGKYAPQPAPIKA